VLKFGDFLNANLKQKIFPILAIVAFLAFQPCALAAEAPVQSQSFSLDFVDLGGPTNLKDFALRIMKFLNLTIAASATLGIMVGGVVIMTAAGVDGQISFGKEILKYSLIGLAATLGAYVLVTFVQTVIYWIAG